MKSKWPLVKLGEAINYRKEFITVDDLEIYKRCTAHLHAKGVSLRDEIEGSRLKTKEQQVCKAGDLLVAEIDAKVGGFGIVPSELEGAIVSSHYFLFEIDEQKLDRKYLDYFIRTHEFQKQINARGSTNYAAIRPKHILDIEILLPPFEEQKRIVAKIEGLMARVEEARRLSERAEKEAEGLLLAELGAVFSDAKQMRTTNKVENICTKPQYGYTDSAKRDPVGPKFLRITDIQNGKVNWEEVPYSSCPEKERYLLHTGDILFARSGATTGKSFLVQSPPESVFASYLIRIRPQEGILPEYLYWFFQSPLYWSQVAEKTRASAQPNMNGKKLSDVQVQLPDSEETQRRIVAYLDSLQVKIDELKKLQAETEKELVELVPSILDKAV